MLKLSLRERDRLVLVRQVLEKELTVTRASETAGLSRRQFHRILKRVRTEGDGGVIHGSRGKRSNGAKSEAMKARVLERAREPVFYDFGPTLLAEHIGRDPDIGEVNPYTLRLWMIEAGLWGVKPRRLRHRRRRVRRAAFGELVQMDTSIHPWLEHRNSGEMVLVALIDDATSRLLARFFPRDTGAANRQLLIEYIERFGRMSALYVDRASHFKGHFRASERRAKDLQAALTLIERALGTLDIAMIHALSPQAKGRVERSFGTLQDRLIKEMRVADVSTLSEANHFLEHEFIPFWNTRFSIAPADPTDAHRSVPKGTDLQRLFAYEEQRVISPDFVIRYRNVFYQIEKLEADARMPKSKITVETRLDGSLHFRWHQRYLNPTKLGRLKPTPEPEVDLAPRPRAKPTPPRPGPNHPWRRPGVLTITNRHKRGVRASGATARLSPESES